MRKLLMCSVAAVLSAALLAGCAGKTVETVEKVVEYRYVYLNSPSSSTNVSTSSATSTGGKDDEKDNSAIVVAIDKEHFPNLLFRNYVSANYDKNSDGSLSENEIKRVEFFDLWSSGVDSLVGIEYFTNLTRFSCIGCSLTELDLSKNTKLKEIRCDNNKITTLKLPDSESLESLSCESNNLSSIDVSAYPNLESLHCGFNQLTELDVSKNLKLASLQCWYNDITSLDISKNTELTQLYCKGTKIATLDIRNNKKLSDLEADESTTIITDDSTTE